MRHIRIDMDDPAATWKRFLIGGRRGVAHERRSPVPDTDLARRVDYYKSVCAMALAPEFHKTFNTDPEPVGGAVARVRGWNVAWDPSAASGAGGFRLSFGAAVDDCGVSTNAAWPLWRWLARRWLDLPLTPSRVYSKRDRKCPVNDFMTQPPRLHHSKRGWLHFMPGKGEPVSESISLAEGLRRTGWTAGMPDWVEAWPCDSAVAIRREWKDHGNERGWLDRDVAPRELMFLFIDFAKDAARKHKFLSRLHCSASKNDDGLSVAIKNLVSQYMHELDAIVSRMTFVAPGGFMLHGRRGVANTAFPVSFAADILIEADEDDSACRVVLKPASAPKVSKPNLGVGGLLCGNSGDGVAANRENLAEAYSGENPGGEGDLTLDVGVWFEHLDGYGDENLFRGSDLADPEKWDAAIEWLVQRNEFHDLRGIFSDMLFLFDPKEEVKALYESYVTAATTLSAGKDKEYESRSVLGRMLGNEKARAAHGVNAGTQHQTHSGDAWNGLACGMLREQRVPDGNDTAGGHYGLNSEQRDFCAKTLAAEQNNWGGAVASDVYAIALNGPPGTGKTTALQTLVASEVVLTALDKSPPRIIFGASATHQAKRNIIGGFAHGAVHGTLPQTPVHAGILERWIDAGALRQGEVLDYGLELGGDGGRNDLKTLKSKASELLEAWQRHYADAVSAGASLESRTSRQARLALCNLLGAGAHPPETLAGNGHDELDSLRGCLAAWHGAMQDAVGRLRSWLADLHALAGDSADGVCGAGAPVVPAWLNATASTRPYAAAVDAAASMRRRRGVVGGEMAAAEAALSGARDALAAAESEAMARASRSRFYMQEWSLFSTYANRHIGAGGGAFWKRAITWWMRGNGGVLHWLGCHVSDLDGDGHVVRPMPCWAAGDRRLAYLEYARRCAFGGESIPGDMPRGMLAMGAPPETSARHSLAALAGSVGECEKACANLRNEAGALDAGIGEAEAYAAAVDRIMKAAIACNGMRDRLSDILLAAPECLGTNRARVEHGIARLDALRARLDCLAGGWPADEASGDRDAPAGDIGHSVANDMDDLLRGLLDNAYKVTLFHLASRWHEGMALGELKGMDFSGKGRRDVEKRYRVLARIFPVMVTTLAALGRRVGFFNTFNRTGIALIDMLLVDEAGQAAPELGGIGLLAARLCVAVGDSRQIPPVFNIDGKTDWPLAMTRLGLADTEDERERFSTANWSCHHGSVLGMAQDHTPWAPMAHRGLERGLWLLEHNRCPIEIISLCDALLYHGSLKYAITSFFHDGNGGMTYARALGGMEGNPVDRMSHGLGRNKKIDARGVWPGQPLLFVPCHGESVACGSRTNREEAEAILRWLDTHYHDLCGRNEDGSPTKPLSEVFAVLSPFRAQADLIRKLGVADDGYPFENVQLLADRKALFASHKTDGADSEDDSPSPIVIGTVHSLQGAEVQVVAFSNVYGDNDNGSKSPVPFVDGTPNILNVALSRAKRSFVLFGSPSFLDGLACGHRAGGATARMFEHIRRFGGC